MADAKASPGWERQAVLFVALVMLSNLLLCGGWLLTPATGPAFADGWLWVVAFPYRLAKELDAASPLVGVLLVLNSVVYAAGWWLAWRMFVLMRRKPE